MSVSKAKQGSVAGVVGGYAPLNSSLLIPTQYLNRPAGFIGAAVYASADVSTSNSGEAVTAMNSELFDTDGFHDNATNNGRFTIPAGMGGRYLVTYSIHLSSTPGSSGYAIIRKNGGTILSMCNFHWDGASHGSAEGSAIVDLAAGDYVEMKNLTSTVATMTGTSTWAPWFSIAKLDSGKVGGGIGAKAYHSTIQNVTSGTPAVLTLDTEEFDSDGFHSTSSNTSRMTIPAGLGGKYLVIAASYFSPNGGGQRIVAVWKNGATVGGHEEAPGHGTFATRFHTSVVLDLVSGDYIEALVYQDSGSTLTVGDTAYDTSSQLTIARLDSGSSGEGETFDRPLIPSLWANSWLGYTASSSSSYNTTQDAFAAFHDAPGLGANSWVGWLSATSTGWLGIQMPHALVATSYAVMPWWVDSYPGRCLKTWTLEGSNNGSSWTTLDTQTNFTAWPAPTPTTPKMFTFSNTTAYSYYRLNVSENQGNAYLGIGWFQLFGPVRIAQ